MKLTHYSSENYFLPACTVPSLTLYSQTHLDRHLTYQRLLTLIQKVVGKSDLFSTPVRAFGNAKYMKYGIEFTNVQNWLQQEQYESQMEQENYMENTNIQPKLQHKTSIQDRLPQSELNPQIEQSQISTSILPSEKWIIDDTSLNNINPQDSLTIQHLQTLFTLEDTGLMITTIGFLSKLSAIQKKSDIHPENALIKFATCYILAYKLSHDQPEMGIISGVSQILGLNQSTLLDSQKEVLYSMDFCLQLSKQYLQEITRLLFE